LAISQCARTPVNFTTLILRTPSVTLPMRSYVEACKRRRRVLLRSRSFGSVCRSSYLHIHMNKRHNATWTYKTCPISISEVTDYETKWTAFYVHFSRIAKSVLVVAILSVRPSVRPSVTSRYRSKTR